MLQTQKQPVLATRAVSEIGSRSAAISVQNNRTFHDEVQYDIVARLARRSGVDPASIVAQMAAWGMEVRS